MAQEGAYSSSSASPSVDFAALALAEGDRATRTPVAESGPAPNQATAASTATQQQQQPAAAEGGAVSLLSHKLPVAFRTACRHRGHSLFGSRTSDGSLGEQDWIELFACVQDCWDRVHPGPWIRPVHSHVCSPSCPLICHYDAYVCPFSCAVHHCTEWTCEYAKAEGSVRICPLTSNQFPLSFQNTFSEVGHLDKQRQRDIRTGIAGGAKSNHDHLSIRSSAAADAPAAAATQSSSATGPRRKKANSSYASVPLSALASSSNGGVHQDTILQIANFISLFLVAPLPLHQRELLALEIFEIFRCILSTGIELPDTFTVVVATFTCLYAFTRPSLSMGPVVFVRFHPELLGQLRTLHDSICVVLKRPFRAHTLWTNLLLNAMVAHCKRAMPVVNFAAPAPASNVMNA